MKHFRTSTTVILSAALFYLAFPQAVFAAAAAATAAAASDGGHSITVPQLLVLGFVLGLYLYNHFKAKIKAMFKKKQ